mmetsp:Transcript_103430/g.288120  ORF Transcript_103430/g.288120 Transcript_103430/m.288120 type:complete len:280 (-) Transcript_103430:8-847(-)
MRASSRARPSSCTPRRHPPRRFGWRPPRLRPRRSSWAVAALWSRPPRPEAGSADEEQREAGREAAEPEQRAQRGPVGQIGRDETQPGRDEAERQRVHRGLGGLVLVGHEQAGGKHRQRLPAVGLCRVGTRPPALKRGQPFAGPVVVEAAVAAALANALELGDQGAANGQQAGNQQADLGHGHGVLAQRRSDKAWAMVPRSTYSSSLPTGTPRASRVDLMPRARNASASTWAVASPSAVKLVARMTSSTPASLARTSSSAAPIWRVPTPSSGLSRPSSTK